MNRSRRRARSPISEGGARARITATEMVGVPLTTKEVRRLLDAMAEGKLGPPDDLENVALRRKFEVMLQVATATENRRAALPSSTPRK